MTIEIQLTNVSASVVFVHTLLGVGCSHDSEFLIPFLKITKSFRDFLEFQLDESEQGSIVGKWTYQLSHVGRRRLRPWTSLGLKSLRNFTSVFVVHFQNGLDVGIGHDRFFRIARLATLSPSGILPK
jgi:hypothetical protein